MTKFLNNADVKGYVAQTAVTSSLLKTDSAGKLVAAVAGTDYNAPDVSAVAGTLIREIRNTTGATLTKGTVVYISGATGNKATVSKAIATGDSTSAQTFGLCQTDIANNSVGYVVCVGDITGVDTSAFTEGVQLYLSSTTAGTYTSTKQLAPAHLVYVGVVTRSHPTLGQIEVKIQNGYELDEIHDVSISSLANNQTIVWESATSLWKNKTIAAVLGYTPANDSNVVKLTGDQTVAGVKTFTSVVNAPTLSLNGGILAGNNIVSMRSNPTGGQFRIEKSDGSLSAYPFYIGVDGTALAYYYNASGALKVLLHTNDTSYFGNSLSVGYSTYASTSYMLDINGTARFVGALTGASATFTDTLSVVAPASSTAIALRGRSGDNYSALRFQSNNGTTTYATIYSNGSDFHIENGGSAALTIAANRAATFSSSVATGGDVTISTGSIKMYSVQNAPGQYRYIGTEYAAGNGNNKAEIRFGIDGSDTRTKITLHTANGGGQINEVLGVFASGQLKFNNYTASTSFSGTAAGYLAFDSSGNVITVAGVAATDNTKLPLAGGTMTGQLIIGTTGIANSPSVRINTSSSASFVHTQENFAANLTAGQRAMIFFGKVGSTKNAGGIGYYWAGDASNSNFITLGHWGNDDLLRVYGDGVVQTTGYLRTAGVTSNTVLFNAGASSVDFGNAFGQGTTNRSVYFRGNTGVSAWWGGVDANGANIPFAAIDATAGEFTFWRNTAGTGGGTWTQIMTMNASGLTINSGIISVLTAPSGASAILGSVDYSRVYNDSNRHSLVINAPYYPHLYINATSSAANANHGATISMSGVLSAGGYRRWGMGIPNTDPAALSWGYYDNNSNPHYGVGGTLGYTATGAIMWLDTSGNLQTTGSMRSAQFRFTNSTNNAYLTGNSDWGFRVVNDSGYIQFGPANGSWAHIYSGLPFYFNQALYVNGTQVVTNSGTWSINVNGTANNITAYTINQSVGTGNSPSFVEGIFGTTGGATNQGIQIRYQNYTSGYGRIRFYQSDSNHMTIHAFSDSWQGGGFGSSNSAGAINIAGGAGVTFGGWNSCDAYIASGGAGWFRTSVTVGTVINLGGSSSYSFGTNYWAGAGGYPGYSFTGGNSRFGFSSTGGYIDVFTDGNFYAGIDLNGNNNLVLHSGNISGYTAGNTNSISSAVGGAYTWTGVNYFRTNQGGYCGSLDNGRMQAYSDSNNSAFFSFHKGGYYAVNMGLDADNVIRIGGWSASANRWQLDMSGNCTVAGSMYGSYFYGSGSIRCGDMWGGAGLYRPSGDMVFGTEAANWVFSSQANTRAYFAGGDGNLWMQWSGEWLSTTLGRKHQDGASPSYSTVYSSNWFRSTGNTGWYNDTYGQGLRQSKGNVSYGNVIVHGENYNGWSGYNTNLSTITAFMQNSSGTHGFYQENNAGWTLFWNAGYACWGLGTDATDPSYSLHITKYGGSNTGWIIWSDRRIKENIKTIDSALDKVLSLRGVYYNKIDDPNKERQVGYIAQEVLEVVPELVVYSEELDIYNMNYAPMVSMLTEATKEHYAKTLAQQAEIDALKEQVQTLLNHINNGV